MAAPQPVVSVHKFGGAALADGDGVRRVVRILRATAGAKIVVTSALAGVTDRLLDAATRAATGALDQAMERARELRERHVTLAGELLGGETRRQAVAQVHTAYDELERLLTEVDATRILDPRMTDRIVARGERISAPLVAGALTTAGIQARAVDAVDVVQTDGRHGNAAPDLARTEAAARERILALAVGGVVVVVPGFVGAGKDGDVVTLGRGGSDLTATVLARALGAGEVTLWKDVPGFLTADPRVVPQARVVPQLDPREASELAYYGAKVLHPRALTPLDARTTLRIRPFADVHAAGTRIVPGRGGRNGGSLVRALSAMPRQALVTVAGNGMLGVPGIAARTFGAMATAGISVSLISQASSEHSICFTVPEPLAADAESRLRDAFRDELARREIDEIDVLGGLSTIAVVGSGMAYTPGIAARVFEAVAGAGVNVVAIAQGSSERNISLVVESRGAADAVRAIHGAFRLDKVGGGSAAQARGADLILLGHGRIGRELVQQIAEVNRRDHAGLRVVGVIDRSGFVFDRRGLGPKRLDALAGAKQRGGGIAGLPGARKASARDALEFVASHALTRPVLVDVATGDTRAALTAAVAHGMDIVLANKVPLASEATLARALLRDARAKGRRVLHEATVGAGLPVIDTIEKLIASGDRLLHIEGCPSGTMGYLFGEMGRGVPFSTALREAMRLGYTEPDPRDDLSGLDVARKALILGRLLGFAGELEDVALESLVPPTLREVPLGEFLGSLETLDAEWAARVEEARARGEVLRYRARASRAAVKVGLVSVPAGSSLGSLDGTDNQFIFTTARYREHPLVITGPGAGPAVTAAGILNDILRLMSR